MNLPPHAILVYGYGPIQLGVGIPLRKETETMQTQNYQEKQTETQYAERSPLDELLAKPVSTPPVEDYEGRLALLEGYDRTEVRFAQSVCPVCGSDACGVRQLFYRYPAGRGEWVAR